MKIVVSTIGTFHFVDLAIELSRLGHDVHLFSGYPRWKLDQRYLLNQTGIKVITFPFLQTAYILRAYFGLGTDFWSRSLARLSFRTFDRYVSYRLPPCDAFIGQARLSLLSGKAAQRQGAVYVCDVGSSHVRSIRQLLEEEFIRRGRRYSLLPDDVVERETEEYSKADAISVLSQFALNSFVAHGVDKKKLWLNPPRIDLTKFKPLPTPEGSSKLEILYVGSITFRKGVPDLLEAVKDLRVPFQLKLAGSMSRDLARWFRFESHDRCVKFLGPQDSNTLARLMNEADVLVLPSIEDGFGMVILEALACGCPVIASHHSGGSEIIEDGKTGFLVEPGNVVDIREKLEKIFQWKKHRAQVREACVDSVKHFCVNQEGVSKQALRYVCNLKQLIANKALK